MDEGKLPAEEISDGTHRRVHIKDLREFMHNEDIKRAQLMREMAAITEDIGGDDEMQDWKGSGTLSN